MYNSYKKLENETRKKNMKMDLKGFCTIHFQVTQAFVV